MSFFKPGLTLPYKPIVMAPSLRDAWKELPPPTIYPVKEPKFDKFIPPQTDGHEKALAQPEGTAAIVIDNGN